MKSPTDIKPTHKSVKDYYAALAAYVAQGVAHESALRSAFQNLLTETGRRFGWTLIPELSAEPTDAPCDRDDVAARAPAPPSDAASAPAPPTDAATTPARPTDVASAPRGRRRMSTPPPPPNLPPAADVKGSRRPRKDEAPAEPHDVAPLVRESLLAPTPAGIPSRGPRSSRIRPDGTFRDDFYIERGYWEAKDTHDDLETEIKKKTWCENPFSHPRAATPSPIPSSKTPAPPSSTRAAAAKWSPT